MIFGAGSRFALVFACCSRRIDVVWKCRVWGREVGRKWMRGVDVHRKALALRLDCARQAVDILLVAIIIYSTEYMIREEEERADGFN
jgi:hypothetical protein